MVGTTLPRIQVDEVLDINSSNAVANKVVAEVKKGIADDFFVLAGNLDYCGMAVDDHEERITALETEITEFEDGETASLGIMNGTVDYYGVISQSIDVTVVGNVAVGFSSALYFATPSEMPSNYSQFPADVYFKGDSTDNGAFVPEANMRYTIVFDFDGYMLNGYVSGVTRV